jgi:G3E family GTPase
VVTGFLGAGKTTVLAHVLGGALAGERVAIVINELGDISIDGRVIENLGHGERMVELAGGCVCCTIDDLSFEAGIQALVQRADPTLIVLETTGAADPGPVRERIARAGLQLDAIITVVDAASFESLAGEAVATVQVRAADFVLINKTDLVSSTERARLRRRLSRLNRRAGLFECERGRVPADVLFATAARRYRNGSRPDPHQTGTAAHHSHGAGADISAFSWRGRGDLDRRRFERFLAGLPSDVYRAKGLVRFPGAVWACLFSYTCGRYELNWIQLRDAAAQAVFIGRGIDRVREQILQALEACEAR